MSAWGCRNRTRSQRRTPCHGWVRWCALPRWVALRWLLLPLPAAGFSLDTSAALRYKKPTHRRPLTAAWRGYGAADSVYAYGLAVSLDAPGLGAHPTSSPSLCAHPPRRTDTAPRACRRVGGSSPAELHHFASATIVG